MKTCTQCATGFEILAKDQAFYGKMNVPEPNLCPTCRSIHRLSFRNEWSLYHRKSNLSGKQMITMYAPENPYVIYDQDEWWSDQWDPLKYGRDFDFNRPFFEQFAELQKVVPRMSLNVIGNENSTYTNYALRNKDSYLIYTADFCESSCYGRVSMRGAKNCFDFDFVDRSEFCYECVDVYDSYQCFYSQDCHNSSNLWFCKNMKSSKNCLFSCNQINKEYLIFNQPVSPEEFEEKKNQVLGSYATLKIALKKAQEFFLKNPVKENENLQCENTTGNYLSQCRNTYDAYDSSQLEDCRYVSYLYNCKDCYDWDFVGNKSELCYQVLSSAYQLQRCIGVMNSWDVNTDLFYCDLMLGSKSCFGSIGLRKKEYCTFNKQY
ncbi:hypothetical protein IPJ72_05855 [Candidatus Peregrinibacteria bacterium]|nr:MAG: hypothetical protein IPJ72_05855 [Candidatus Peregrinibacteria bacterium]